MKKLVGEGLLGAEGEKWSKLRKISNHAFYGESLKGMVPAMIASVEAMLERWSQHDGNEIELATIIARNSLKIRFPGIGKILRSRDDIEGHCKIKDDEHDLK
ncbi:hypothetical protein Vadar_012669 [Vaccinium darrowii]|uniref:Uncharacterized protein n=1 Tax=Vaccinium darrowii TaxID=229202 RepID=A0ACB7X010_9ERIC|nr:hypothetical protein Vadar_012669 [Vaccinium darrowii]